MARDGRDQGMGIPGMGLLKLAEKALEGLVALLLFALVAMVFLNVMLRFGFSSGIVVTEEVSRIVLSILIFSGAVLAAIQQRHIAMTLVVDRLPRPLAMAAALLGGAVILYCDWLLAAGAFKQAGLSWNATYAVSGLPQATTYVVACAAAVLLAVIVAARMVLLVMGRIQPSDFFSAASADIAE